MKTYSMKTILILGAILLVTGIAFAHGRGYHMGGGYGGGYHMMNGGGYGMMNGYGGNHMMDGYDGYPMMNGYHHGWNTLSAEDQKKMQDEMNTFFEDTKDLRAEYSQKRAELAREYAAPEKNQAAIDSLEKELFDISAKLNKARFDHMTTMRKQFGGDTYGMGYGMGYGRGCF